VATAFKLIQQEESTTQSLPKSASLNHLDETDDKQADTTKNMNSTSPQEPVKEAIQCNSD